MLFIASDFASITSHIHNWELFCFGSSPSFFLELFLHRSLVAYWAPTDVGNPSFSALCFYLFILFMGFSREHYWSGLPFPSPVDHILSELSIMTHLSRVTLHSMAQSFIELDKAVVHVIRLVSFLWLCFLSICPLTPSLSVYPLYWGFSHLGYGVSPHSPCSWPWMWGISSHHSSFLQPPLAAPAQ